MPDNVFRIPIVAIDQTTAVVRRVNVTKPLTDVRNPAAASANGNAPPGSATAGGKNVIEVVFWNVPAGMTADVT